MVVGWREGGRDKRRECEGWRCQVSYQDGWVPVVHDVVPETSTRRRDPGAAELLVDGQDRLWQMHKYQAVQPGNWGVSGQGGIRIGSSHMGAARRSRSPVFSFSPQCRQAAEEGHEDHEGDGQNGQGDGRDGAHLAGDVVTTRREPASRPSGSMEMPPCFSSWCFSGCGVVVIGVAQLPDLGAAVSRTAQAPTRRTTRRGLAAGDLVQRCVQLRWRRHQSRGNHGFATPSRPRIHGWRRGCVEDGRPPAQRSRSCVRPSPSPLEPQPSWRFNVN